MGNSEITATGQEQSVHDVVLRMLADDQDIDADARNWVLEALAEVEGNTDGTQASPAPTYLSTISVVGFRGIGRQARLDLHPTPGLMVVSGRNGSGKSSFAEALELALTGTSYRWHNKAALWEEAWRNLHHPEPCAIRVGFTAEGVGTFTVGMEWKAGAELTDRTSWTQTGSDQRLPGTADLGWSRPLELWRPILSYEELGRLFDGGPSALYDALSKLLGLEVLTDAEKWLGAQIKLTKTARDRADAERKELVKALSGSDDDRAQRAVTLLRKRGGAPIDEVLALATGSDDEGQRVVAALRALTQIEVPSLDDVETTATRLRSARETVDNAAHTLADNAAQRIDVLSAALQLHEHAGDLECPLCGEGRLDGEWATRTRTAIAETEESLREYRSAQGELAQARSAAVRLTTLAGMLASVPGVDLPRMADYNAAVDAARARPDGDTELAAHIEATLIVVIGAAEAARAEAEQALHAREDEWAPLAARLAAWVNVEQEARKFDGTLNAITAAKRWVTDRSKPFRNQRLESIAAQARKIWRLLRQESNVDLGEITLQGTATHRKAVLSGSVDGEPTKALPVMSQGELHALALALFLPRATSANSPFRFIVLDDPIQAMDPAKIDGFVQVLGEVAKTHQVIVFSHDDRLASVIRETGVDARMVEVVRETGSKVTARDNVNPARRTVSDVFAVVKDDGLPDEIRARVVPGLFRMAVEAAAKQAFYAKQSLAGRPRIDAEQAWASAKKTSSRLALAIHGDPGADLTGWLDAKRERRNTLRLCNAVHGAARGVSKDEARDLERTVETLLALR
ncbi:hypothetical protein MPRF_04790 [Mycolicibacterium parafortuitum]|uniref:Nuclease SbcCD subunit C n=1 Tax=Mycolicibacterium parafortuitum TaxID=39692 RepID=A0A7I7TWT8_MYCPF|nr:AAA family ATPase [Mycolicibacterium parafortuitum]BBY73580.1 hypothetical protein MPRF_04790 [Mycolicibacterium parafortuitum]